MACKHLKELFELCQTHGLRLSSTDLIRIVCPACGAVEVCPSVLLDQCASGNADADDASSDDRGA